MLPGSDPPPYHGLCTGEHRAQTPAPRAARTITGRLDNHFRAHVRPEVFHLLVVLVVEDLTRGSGTLV